MRQRHKIFSVVITTFLFSIILFSCKKDPIVNDSNLSGDFIGDGFVQDDTFDIYTVNKEENWVYGKNRLLSPIGVINDPVFGNTQSNLYLNFELPATNVSFGTALIFDSLVLNLAYSNKFGANTIPINIGVFELAEQISITKTDSFSTDKTFLSYATPIGNIPNFIPKFSDSIYTTYATLAPSLRIKLADAFGNQLLSQSGQSTLADNASFQNYFKGLFISVLNNNAGNGLANLDVTAPNSKLTLYYKDNGVEKQYSFRTGTANSATVNYYKNNNTNSLAKINSNAGIDSICYLSGLKGFYTEMTIPKLDTLTNKTLARAIMTITCLDTTLEKAPRILMQYLDENGTRYNVIDFNDAAGYAHYDGAPKTAIINGQPVLQYNINLTRHIQRMISGGIKSPKFILSVHSRSSVTEDYFKDYTGNRITVGGGKGNNKIKLNLTYTKTN